MLAIIGYGDSKMAMLLDAANGIASINVKLTDVVDEAQAILARYNTQFRTNFTLAQVRAQFFGP